MSLILRKKNLPTELLKAAMMMSLLLNRLFYDSHIEQIEIDSLSKTSVRLSPIETLKSIIYCPRNVFHMVLSLVYFRSLKSNLPNIQTLFSQVYILMFIYNIRLFY